MTAEGNPARIQVIDSERRPHESADLKHWLGELVSRNGSDLLLVPKAPASIRVEGALSAIGDRPLSGDEIEAAMLGLLSPVYEEIVTGEAEVREVFRVPRIGAIAGCFVLDGVITRGSKVRFLREGTIIWKGSITSLRRFKDDAREVASGFECGIGLSDYQDLKPGDVIETFEEREIPRTA